MMIGLRIDVDTFRGTRYGVLNLCDLLCKHSITATFFFSVGPDNMGRHLWRLCRPAFLFKMLRTKGLSLYGLDILLKGTFWRGPIIGEKLGDVIRTVVRAGHEVGLHAWDHHGWQARIDRMNSHAIHRDLSRGVQLLAGILGHPPCCSAAPSWKCNNLVLMEKTEFSFKFNSDCRGESIFRPLVDGAEMTQPQIPTTLPTYDEVVGHRGVSDGNYNDYLLSLIKPQKLNVLTIHAEVEGMRHMAMFDRFVKMARARGASFVPLGALLGDSSKIGRAALVARETAGRQGWVSWQASAVYPARTD